jgi:hypothetical protein
MKRDLRGGLTGLHETTPASIANSEFRKWSAENAAWASLDGYLLDQYDPAISHAWAGAAPAAWTPPGAQIELFPTAEELIERSDKVGGALFRRAGFGVEPIAGPGAATILDDFVERHHRSLRGRGMNGTAFGLYAPDGELVGIANFAPCANTATAAGMQVNVPEDYQLSPTARAHLTVSERESCDAVRFCLAPDAVSGASLGTGAESYFYAACLRYFVARNRALWRVIRMVERECPLPAWARAMLKERVPFIKIVRSFADPADGHRGTIYAAAGAWYLGMTDARSTLVGRRSGEPLAGRSLTKLYAPDEKGHPRQVARAVWEGGLGQLRAIDPASGAVLGARDLASIRDTVPDGLGTRAHRRALAAAYRAEQVLLAIEVGCDPKQLAWHSEADTGGYLTAAPRPKHRYATFLGRPFYANALARRCRYIRADILSAEAAWFAKHPRWGRGLGYHLPRKPDQLGRSTSPTRRIK